MTKQDIIFARFLVSAIEYKAKNPQALEYEGLNYKNSPIHGGVYNWFREVLQSIAKNPEVLGMERTDADVQVRKYLDIENPIVQKQFLGQLRIDKLLLPFFKPESFLDNKKVEVPDSLRKEIQADPTAEKVAYSPAVVAPLAEQPIPHAEKAGEEESQPTESHIPGLPHSESTPLHIPHSESARTMTSGQEGGTGTGTAATGKSSAAGPVKQTPSSAQPTHSTSSTASTPTKKVTPTTTASSTTSPAAVKNEGQGTPRATEQPSTRLQSTTARTTASTSPQTTTSRRTVSTTPSTTSYSKRGSTIGSSRSLTQESKRPIQSPASSPSVQTSRAAISTPALKSPTNFTRPRIPLAQRFKLPNFAKNFGSDLGIMSRKITTRGWATLSVTGIGGVMGLGLASSMGVSGAVGFISGAGTGFLASIGVQSGALGQSILGFGGRTLNSGGGLVRRGLNSRFGFNRSKGLKNFVTGKIKKRAGLALALASLGFVGLIFLQIFDFGGGTTPTSASPASQPVAVVSSADISSCKFTRAGSPQPIKSSILAGWISQAATNTGVSPQVLASIAMHENPDVLIDYDNNSTAIKTNRYCVNGSSVCVQGGAWQHDGICNSDELQKGWQTATAKGLMQLIDVYNKDMSENDFCDIQKNIQRGAQTLKDKIGSGSFSNEADVKKTVCNYYGIKNTTCPYPGGDYAAEVWTDLTNCQPAASTSGNSCFAGWPTSGIITQGPQGATDHGRLAQSGHYAIDVANSEGTPIYATFPGTVASVCTGEDPTSCGGYGNSVDLRYNNGTTPSPLIKYAHLSTINTVIVEGANITPGTQIGTMGHTGHVEPAGPQGTHLHYAFTNFSLAFPNIPKSITPPSCDSSGDCQPNPITICSNTNTSISRKPPTQQAGAIYGINLGSNDTDLISKVADTVSCNSTGWVVFFATDLNQGQVQKAVDTAYSSGVNLILRLSDQGFTGEGGNNWGDLLNKLTLSPGQIIYVVAGNEPNGELGQDAASATQALNFLGALLNKVDQSKRSQIKIGNAPLAAWNESWNTYLKVWAQSDLMNRIDFWASNDYLIPARSGVQDLSVGPTVNDGSDQSYKQELDAIGKPNLPVIITESGLDPDPSRYGGDWNNNQRLAYFQNSFSRFRQDPRILAVTPLNYINPERGSGGQHDPLVLSSGPSNGGSGLAALAGCSGTGNTGSVSSPQTGTDYWFLLNRQKKYEILYQGTPEKIDNGQSKVIKVSTVNPGKPGDSPTPLPQRLGRRYWTLTGKVTPYNQAADPTDFADFGPYFMVLDIPYVDNRDPLACNNLDKDKQPTTDCFGPVPYKECGSAGDQQCNWKKAGEFAIHGDNKLSDAGSSGCVRHNDSDITEIYNKLSVDNKIKGTRYYIIDRDIDQTALTDNILSQELNK